MIQRGLRPEPKGERPMGVVHTRRKLLRREDLDGLSHRGHPGTGCRRHADARQWDCHHGAAAGCVAAAGSVAAWVVAGAARGLPALQRMFRTRLVAEEGL